MNKLTDFRFDYRRYYDDLSEHMKELNHNEIPKLEFERAVERIQNHLQLAIDDDNADTLAKELINYGFIDELRLLKKAGYTFTPEHLLHSIDNYDVRLASKEDTFKFLVEECNISLGDTLIEASTLHPMVESYMELGSTIEDAFYSVSKNSLYREIKPLKSYYTIPNEQIGKKHILSYIYLDNLMQIEGPEYVNFAIADAHNTLKENNNKVALRVLKERIAPEYDLMMTLRKESASSSMSKETLEMLNNCIVTKDFSENFVNTLNEYHCDSTLQRAKVYNFESKFYGDGLISTYSPSDLKYAVYELGIDANNVFEMILRNSEKNENLFENVKFLIKECGANDLYCKTWALALAGQDKNYEMAKYLIENGAECSSASSFVRDNGNEFDISKDSIETLDKFQTTYNREAKIGKIMGMFGIGKKSNESSVEQNIEEDISVSNNNDNGMDF